MGVTKKKKRKERKKRKKYKSNIYLEVWQDQLEFVAV